MTEKITKEKVENVADGVLSSMGIDKSIDDIINESNVAPFKLKYLYIQCKKLEYEIDILITNDPNNLSLLQTQVIDKLNASLIQLNKDIGSWE